MDETFLNPDAMNPEAHNPGADPELTRAILARTSGSPCERLQAQACAFVDGELDDTRGGLMRAHMAHCPACARLVAALEMSRRALPAMADVDPGPWFTQRVMRATAYAPRPTRRDLRSLWLKLMHRPRIALETAFLGAAASMLGLVVPMPKLPSARIPALVRPVVASAQRVAGPMLHAEQRVATSIHQTLDRVEAPATAPASFWQRWTQRIRGWWLALWKAPKKTTPPPNP